MSKRFLITIITVIVIGIIASIAIFFAKGYTISPQEKRIVGTGIINISSEPDAASVYIDGHLTSATNTTVSSLKPKTYSVKVVKEGFIPWERQIDVREGLVTAVKVTLFPSIPTIYPLTFSGVERVQLSPDGSKIAYTVPAKSSSGEINKKGGIWVWTLIRNQPIAFARSAEPHQIASSQFIDFSKASLRFSPDSKQVLATIGGQNWLLNADNFNSDPRDITAILDATLNSWEEDIRDKDTVRIASIKDPKFKKIASDSARLATLVDAGAERTNLSWSPDETKFISEGKVYDLEEQKEYKIPPARVHIWLPDSRHIIMVEEGTISILDFDGTNKAVIFAGTFLDNFVFPWPDSSRLVIISTFPTPTAQEPNLYGINLR